MTTYIEAILLRLEAEQTNDPIVYLRAAAAFELLDMHISRDRMIDRALYYSVNQFQVEPMPTQTSYAAPEATLL